MASPLRKAFDWTLGLSLIGFGAAMGFVPIVQGWVFVLMGLAVLSSHSEFARRHYERLKGIGRKVRQKVHDARERRRHPDDPA
jgi:hypothetical protein